VLTIDGALGEGGGQILRTSLALSLYLGTPFRIVNLRAARKNPGLARQHLQAINAAAQISAAQLTGNCLGSQELTFIPGPVRPGHYRFDIGTAGSTTLVLQSVLPALSMADGPSTLELQGGTHNPFAPPFDFLEKAFLRILNRMGPTVQARLERYGFYPKGGGKISITIHPAKSLQALQLDRPGEIRSRSATAVIAGLPCHIAERELGVIGRVLNWSEQFLHLREEAPETGPGNALIIEIECEHVTEVFSAFGQRGVRAEVVARQAAHAARRYLKVGVPVGEYLADQLLLPLALAGGGSFNTLRPTLHTQTNIEVIANFLDVKIVMEELGEDVWHITIGK
jgi:RNA 3''-phosphate cyclase